MYISDDAIFMMRAGAWPPSGRPGREVALPRKPAVHGPFLGGVFAAWRPLDQAGGLPRARIRFCSVRAGRRLRPLLVCGRAAGDAAGYLEAIGSAPRRSHSRVAGACGNVEGHELGCEALQAIV